MKCIPMTFSGRFVTEAIFVIEMEEVLVARIHSEGVFASKSLNMLSLRSTFSVAASTTSSRSLTPFSQGCKGLNISKGSLLIVFRDAFFIDLSVQVFGNCREGSV